MRECMRMGRGGRELDRTGRMTYLFSVSCPSLSPSLCYSLSICCREICRLFRDIKYGSMLCTEQSIVVVNIPAARGRVSALEALGLGDDGLGDDGLGGDGGAEAGCDGERVRIFTWKV